MATYGSTVAVQGRSHSNLDRVSEGHNRSRKSFGLCPNNIHSIMQPQAALNSCEFSFFFLLLFSFSFCIAIKRKYKESTKENKRKTCHCLGRSYERKTELMNAGKPAHFRNLWLTSSTRLRYKVVRIITSTVCPKDTIGRESHSAQPNYIH